MNPGDVHILLSRSAYWAGVTQYVDVTSHTNYYFIAHVKLLNQHKAWTKIELFAEIRYHQSTYMYMYVCELHVCIALEIAVHCFHVMMSACLTQE